MKASAQLRASAVRAHQAGQFAEAEKAYLSLLKLNPKDGDALRLLGSLCLQSGQSDRALSLLRKAREILPANPEIHNTLGLTLNRLGKLKEAAASYEQAIRLKPDFLSALNNLALLYQEIGRGKDSLLTFSKAVKISGGKDPKTHYNLANTYREQGHPADAIRHYSLALRLKPDYEEAMINLGLAYAEAGQRERAEDWYKSALCVSPRNVRVMNNLGNFYLREGRFENARDLFDQAIKIKPDYPEAYSNKATVFRGLGKLDEAEALCRKAIEIAPTMAPAWSNLGTIAQDRARHEEALSLFDKAHAFAPALIDPLWNKALSLLALGRLEEGFSLYEIGLGQGRLRGPSLTPEKRWKGEDLAGKRLLIWSEQGLGDSLQFIRYAKFCKEQGAETIVLCPPALRPLFKPLLYIDRIGENLREEDYDLHIPMMSFPFAFRTTLETIPNDVPYLCVSETARAKWADRFPKEKSGLRVGLVWAGNPREHLVQAHLIDRRRSMDLTQLLPLLSLQNICFYSLQKGGRESQIVEEGLQDKIIDFMPEVEDFMDTAALVEKLDLVVTVDTSVAHLAGGLGKPVWILSRFDACWRWLGNRERNPWYPSARLFGQTVPGDWETPVKALTSALQKRALEK